MQLKFESLKKQADNFSKRITDEKLREMFLKCYFNTLDTTVISDKDQFYVITGDIDAMWLRDSSAQVMQYLEFSDSCADSRELIKGLIKRQLYYINCDPYANSFNFEFNGKGWIGDECEKSPVVHERKFELDSLCYPLFLAARYLDKTGDDSVFSDYFYKTFQLILDVFETEQHHENSSYYHYRPTEEPSLSVPNRGKGGKVGYTGMVWSGYRPSDDPCIYGYFIPGNMFICSVMDMLIERKNKISMPANMCERAKKLSLDVRRGIETYGIVNHEKHGKMYAYETDGLGNYNLMDDANVPSLLGIPYIGYLKAEDEIYKNTRSFVLSEDNPYYFSGKKLSGVGSPHTPKDYVWHIGVIMEALTSSDKKRINELLDMLIATTNDTGYMHEGVFCDDDSRFTRSWFAWANSLFSYFLIKKADEIETIK